MSHFFQESIMRHSSQGVYLYIYYIFLPIPAAKGDCFVTITAWKLEYLWQNCNSVCKAYACLTYVDVEADLHVHIYKYECWNAGLQDQNLVLHIRRLGSNACTLLSNIFGNLPLINLLCGCIVISLLGWLIC